MSKVPSPKILHFLKFSLDFKFEKNALRHGNDLDNAGANSKEGSEGKQWDVLDCQPEFFQSTFPSEQVLWLPGEVFLSAALPDHQQGTENGGLEELPPTQPEVQNQQQLERGLGSVLMRGNPDTGIMIFANKFLNH